VNDEALRKAVEALAAGELVAFPTETVYGLGADARNETAVLNIFERKGRPAHHPLIVHLGDPAQVTDWTNHLDARLAALCDAFWPGPLTIVAPRSPLVPAVVTGGLSTVGLRVPSHPVAAALLAGFGDGVAAPSANRFGRVSPTSAQAVQDELGSDILVLDGGSTRVGVESSIVTVEEGRLVLLRHGGVTIERLREAVGPVTDDTHGWSRAAGMMASHYAPRVELTLCETSVEFDRWDFTDPDVAVMGLAVDLPDHGARRHFTMASVDDYARRLYASLRAADELAITRIVVLLPPASGLGTAIRDRLERAAAPAGQNDTYEAQ
jgi:L-threonylcarbamoyladenylate synthase